MSNEDLLLNHIFEKAFVAKITYKKFNHTQYTVNCPKYVQMWDKSTVLPMKEERPPRAQEKEPRFIHTFYYTFIGRKNPEHSV